MDRDKALRKALSRIEAPLPHGFHNRVMDRIHREAALRDQRNDALSVVLAGMVSLFLIAAAVYLLAVYSGFTMPDLIPTVHLDFLSGPSVVYSATLAAIVVVLLLLDLLLRQIMGRANE